jgi:tetratricopeptide (TPR) repeat protein
LALSRLPILNAVAFACAAIVVPASASPPEVVFERAAPSVLVVERIDRNGRRNGFASGVVTGLSQVVTSCHALSGAAGARVRSGERSHAAALVRADPERDLCRLSVEGLDAPPARIVPAGMLRVGQRVYAVGTPKGLERTISEGIISSLRPRARSFVIQTTAPMSRGSSGGGLFDEEGRLVGMAAFQYASGQNLNFAVPASWIGELDARALARWEQAGLTQTADDPLGARFLALMDIGNHPAALLVAREWTQREPHAALPRHALGRSFAALARDDEASTALRSALRIRPDLLAAWLDLAQVQRRQGDAAGALDSSSRALSLAPGSVPGWTAYGLALAALGRPSAAVDALNHALELDREDAAAWDALIATHLAQGRVELAAGAARKALKQDPQSALLWRRFAAVQLQRGDEVQAMQALQEALRLAPQDAAALYELGALYHARGEQAKVRAAYERLRRVDAARAAQFHAAFLG